MRSGRQISPSALAKIDTVASSPAIVSTALQRSLVPVPASTLTGLP